MRVITRTVWPPVELVIGSLLGHVFMGSVTLLFGGLRCARVVSCLLQAGGC